MFNNIWGVIGFRMYVLHLVTGFMVRSNSLNLFHVPLILALSDIYIQYLQKIELLLSLFRKRLLAFQTLLGKTIIIVCIGVSAYLQKHQPTPLLFFCQVPLKSANCQSPQVPTL